MTDETATDSDEAGGDERRNWLPWASPATSEGTGARRSRRQSLGDRFEWLDASLLSVMLGSTAIVIAGALVQVSFGTFTMSVLEAWQVILNPRVLLNPQAWDAFLFAERAPEILNKKELIVWFIRLPRVFVAIFVGMNLAVSGAIFQAVTRNELASPWILGVSSGAGLAILLTLVVFGGLAPLLPLIAAAGGALAFLLVYLLAWKNGTSPVRLVLAGVVVGSAFSSLQTAIYLFADNIGVVQNAIQWTTGSLTGVDWEQVRMVLPWTVAIIVPSSLLAARHLNVLLLGSDTASSLGMNVERVRFLLSGVAVLAAAASIAVAGIVGFVGLIVPHMVRTLVGSDHRQLIVGCLFAGPALMVAADVGARLGMGVLFGSDMQIPVGIVTGLLGTPYFLYLMRREENLGEI